MNSKYTATAASQMIVVGRAPPNSSAPIDCLGVSSNVHNCSCYYQAAATTTAGLERTTVYRPPAILNCNSDMWQWSAGSHQWFRYRLWCASTLLRDATHVNVLPVHTLLFSKLAEKDLGNNQKYCHWSRLGKVEHGTRRDSSTSTLGRGYKQNWYTFITCRKKPKNIFTLRHRFGT